MKVTDWKVGRKLSVGFLTIVMVFVGVIGYEMFAMSNLGKLQDDGAGLAEEAIAVMGIVERVAEVYSVVGDAVINRDIPAS